MRFLLTTIGSSGDVNPFIALGAELLRRGHRVVMLVNPHFEPAVRAAGMDFEPLGERLNPVDFAREQPLCFDRVLGAWMLINRWLVPIVPGAVECMRSAAITHRPNVLVGHQISFGLPWIARQLSIPWATCVLAPGTMLSAHDPSVFPLGGELTHRPLWYRRFAVWGARRSMSFMLDRPLNAIRRSRGLPKHSDTLWGEMFEADAVLGLWSPSLRPPAPDDPPRVTICGFPWHDRSVFYDHRGQQLDDRLERFLDEGEPPVIFTLGSVLSHQGRREFEAAVRACRIVGCRGILVTGRTESMPTHLPPGVVAVDYAPYSLLMPRGCATVHHGGIGTTAQALRAGKPSIIMPFAHDQFDNAARVRRLGAGQWIPRRKDATRDFARAVQRALTDRVMQTAAADLGERISRERGVEAAADRLEEVAAASGNQS